MAYGAVADEAATLTTPIQVRSESADSIHVGFQSRRGSSVSGRSGASGEENISYAGKKLEEEKGMPAGPSIIGNRRFTPGTATDEGAEMEETLLITNEATVTGRLSWEQLFPD